MAELAENTAAPAPQSTGGAPLVRAALLNAAVPVVVAGLSLAGVRLIFRGLDANAYGAWIAALTLADSLSFLSLGLGRTIARHVARRVHAAGRDALLEGAWVAHALVGVLGALVVIACGRLAPRWLGIASEARDWVSSLFAAAAVIFLANQLLAFCNEVLAGRQRFHTTNAINLVFAAARLGGIALIAAAGMTPVRIASLHAWIVCASLVVTLAVLKPSTFGVRLLPRGLDLKGISAHVRFGLTSQVVAGFSALTWQAAPLLLGFAYGPSLITSYYVAMRIPSVLLAGVWNLAMVLFPAAASKAESGEHGRLVLVVGARTVLIVLAPAVVVASLAPEFILQAWLGDVPDGTVTVLRLGLTTIILDAIASSSVQLLWGTANMRPIVSGTAFAAGVACAAMLPLAYAAGLTGAAVALMLAVATGSAIFIMAALRQTHLSVGEFATAVSRGLGLPLTFTVIAVWGMLHVVSWRGFAGAGALATLSCVVFFGAFWFLGATSAERDAVTRLRVWPRLRQRT